MLGLITVAPSMGAWGGAATSTWPAPRTVLLPLCREHRRGPVVSRPGTAPPSEPCPAGVFYHKFT